MSLILECYIKLCLIFVISQYMLRIYIETLWTHILLFLKRCSGALYHLKKKVYAYFRYTIIWISKSNLYQLNVLLSFGSRCVTTRKVFKALGFNFHYFMRPAVCLGSSIYPGEFSLWEQGWSHSGRVHRTQEKGTKHRILVKHQYALKI